MALIKNALADRMVKDAIVLDLGDISREAQRITATAREEARRIVEQAQIKAQQLIDAADAKGREQGFEQGLAEGRMEGQQRGHEAALAEFSPQIRQTLERWEKALGQWESDRTAMLREGREDVLALAIAIGRRVVHRVPRVDPSIVAQQIEAALELVSRRTRAVIRVHPENLALAQQVLPTILARLDHDEQTTLIEDAAVEPGGCVVSTAGGAIDATISGQLDRIVQELFPDGRSIEPSDSTPGSS